MSDESGNNVLFINSGAFICAFSVQWDGGESQRTPELQNGQSFTLDLTKNKIPENKSCWARAYIVAGPNHDSGRNFNYVGKNRNTIEYTITGSVFKPSFN
jgi:hypothetical protein